MKAILILANVLLIGLMVGLFYILQWRGHEFAFGLLFAIALFQSAYRIKHGEWFDI